MEAQNRPVVQGYELLDRIGMGGFGVVYRAFQSTVGREVAVKIIKPALANNADFIRRFEIEAQLIARLEHLHIVPLYDFWRNPQGAYLVMRWLRGGNLKDALRSGPFEMRMASTLLGHVASGLAAAHERQIIHRDIKPSNILLDEDGNAYLSDFGIAWDVKVDENDDTKRYRGGKSLRSSALDGQYRIAGSLPYLAPELLQGQEATPQSDIYSLGITLFEILAGHHPFPGPTSVQQLFNQINEPLPRIGTLDGAVSDAVHQVVQKATAKNPKHRYRDALALAAAFREAAELEQASQPANIVESLTRREQEILLLISEGKTNRQIAQALFIELSTVKWHITQLYKKLGARSRVQATVRARELNLIVSTEEIEGEQDGTASTRIMLPEPVNPYKGLRSFSSADNRDYFGREGLVETLMARFAPSRGADSAMGGGGERFLAIVGPSGSGKSSLLKAGLIPAFWSGKVPGSEKWFIVNMVPAARPMDELEIALMRIAADQGGNLRALLDRDVHGLSRAASLILPHDDSELLIVIDQFEDLFTLVEKESTRRQFLDLICEAVSDPRSRVRVIIALRADKYDRPLQYPDFGELLREHVEILLPLSAKELERAILGPAERAGMAFENGLVATIIEDVSYRPGYLPLLQFALTELFELREGRLLTNVAYRSFGGATGALARRAEDLYLEHTSADQELIRQLFLRLVSVGEESNMGDANIPDRNSWSFRAEPRRHVLRSELLSASSVPDRLDEIIDTYADYRLLSLDHHPTTRQPTVEVAHEAVMLEWGRLRDWLAESGADLAQHRQLMRAAADWIEANEDWSFLLRGNKLAQFEAWATNTDIVLSETERAFLDASLANRKERAAIEQARRKREADLEQRANQRLRALVVIISLALLVSFGLTIAAISNGREARAQERLAVSRELAASALSQLESDTQRGILLALAAAETTYRVNGSLLSEVEEVLHEVLEADRVWLSFKSLGSAVAYSPDGRMLAFRDDDDGLLKVWDAATGEIIQTLGAHLHQVNDISFSPDARLIASAGDDTLVRLWDVSSGQEKVTLLGHGDLVHDIAFSPDGRKLVTGSRDGLVRLWAIDFTSPRDGKPLQISDPLLELRASAGYEPTGVAFSPDGTRIAAYYPGSAVFIWDAESAKRLLQIPGTGDFITGIDFSPDGTLIAGGAGSVGGALWDATTGEVVARLPAPSPVTDVDFSPDGLYVATSGEDGTVVVWDGRTGQEHLRLTGYVGRSSRVDFSPEGRYLAVGYDGQVMIWDLSSSGSRELFTLEAYDGVVFDAVYSPDGTRIATTGADGWLKLWDAEKGKMLWRRPGLDMVNFPAFDDIGRRLAAPNDRGSISIWEVSTGEEILALNDTEPAWISVAFSPDGTQLAAGSPLGSAQIWNARTGEPLKTFHNNGDQILRVLIFPDGTLAAFDAGGWMYAWDSASGEMLCRAKVSMFGSDEPIWDAEFGAAGPYLATASWDGSAKVTLLGEPPCSGSDKTIYVLRGHSGNVTGVSFNPDNTLLATSGFDSTTRIWDMKTGEERLTLSGHNLPVSGVDFSPDGRYLAAAGSDGTVRVYIMSIDELLSEARSRVTRSLTREECQRFLHQDSCPDD